MNDLIDKPTVNGSFLRFLAMSQGVSSRSGPVKATVDGTVLGSDEGVRATFSRDSLDLKFHQPVETDIQGRVVSVRGFGDAAMQKANQIAASYAKKGFTAQLEIERSNENPQLRMQLTLNTFMIRRQMFKIAYLTTVRIFGDEAITGPSGQQFRAAMIADSDDALARSKIVYAAFQPLPLGLARSAGQAEHAITCVTMPRVGLVTSVELFGAFTLFAVTPADGISADEGTGEVIIINASSSKITIRPYLEAMPSLVEQFSVNPR
jgi:hypothetical protein